MAAVRRRGDSQWQVEVRKKGYPAQRRTFISRADAERWGKETEIAIERGLFFDRTASERTTLLELIERYRLEVVPTMRGKHVKPALNQLQVSLGQYALASITGEMIAKHRDARLKTVAASTVKKEINLLSSLIDLAGKEWGIPLAANPCKMVKRPPEPKGRDRRLEAGEEALLLKACEESGHELTGIVRVALETGARLGELLDLQWKHVDLSNQTARLLDTKNGEDRTIPLSSAAVSALKSLPVRHISGRVFHNWAASDSFNKTWSRAVKRAGIENLKFHDLRHEAVSRLFEKGLNPMEAASVSGHKTLAMLKRYTHLRAEDLAKKLG
ncbi:MAG: site-specific integrase [Thiothrix sp.]|uniref:site-specific integrase n=1 Tax=Thiothrix sp. TaxID=1032 RepID=UPI00261448D0|nr:site-specific integrase [Thiothrix sp.]MDD5395494.1 site-specific integrase [Thiothrix sp.]